MIASYSRNFIFIKTKKTAGTSAEMVLSAWCSERDVCTPISPASAELARRALGGMPRNFTDDPAVEAELHAAIASGEQRAIRKARRGAKDIRQFGGHEAATTVRSALPDLWEGAFKFAVERHPYEKAVSQAFMRVRAYPALTFGEILDDIIAKERYRTYQLYTDRRKRVIVDELVPFDRMWQRIGELGASFGQAMPETLPRAKATSRTDRRPAREILTEAQRRRIARAAAFEFELMGFEP